jgi:very-short-patch-repair endonuclease
MDEHRLAAWLRHNDRLLTAAGCVALGLTPGARRHLVKRGRLRPVGHGILVDASAEWTPELATRVALLRAGDGAVASHLTAAALWDLVAALPATPHITVGRDRRMRVPGVVVHQSRVAWETGVRRGLPVTSASRTLLDLAALPSMTPQRLTSLTDEALQRRLTAVPKLVAMVRWWPGGRCQGGPRLLQVLDAGGHLSAPEASVLERRMAKILARLHQEHGLPEPVVEHRVEGGRWRLDFAWPALLFSVEVDGYLWHRSRRKFDYDRDRGTALTSSGWILLPFSWTQVVEEPGTVAERILGTYRWVSSLRAS